MTESMTYRGIRIVTLASGEAIADYCRPDDIVIVQDEYGWWTCFVGEDGTVEKYDAPFPTREKAMQVARAAAEYSAE